MGEPLWPVMTREQWNKLVEAIETVEGAMRVHLGREATTFQLLDLALRAALEELERRCEERRHAAPF